MVGAFSIWYATVMQQVSKLHSTALVSKPCFPNCTASETVLTTCHLTPRIIKNSVKDISSCPENNTYFIRLFPSVGSVLNYLSLLRA